jgi:excisionase family DNA binding protein
VLGILANPAYAGCYVFGRYRSRRVVNPDGTVRTTTVELARAQWPVVIYDHHPGYISWADFLANEARLAANTTNQGARPPREGIALCQGIICCGGCGRPMSTRYHPGGRAAYECAASRADQQATPDCRSVAAATLDEAVAERLLAAVCPEEVTLALAAATEVADRHARTTRAAELAVERARYQADRAERAHAACEPENRLVARSLEARWEAKLVALAETEQALAQATAQRAPLPERAELEALTSSLPRLWHAPTTSAKDRKRMLRTLIADVTVLPAPDRAKLRVGIRWHSGTTEELLTGRRPSAAETRRAPDGAVELLRRLGPQRSDAELAEELNTTGYLTGAGRPFDPKAVRWLRHVHKVPAPTPLVTGELSVADVAEHLGITADAVYYWVQHGQLQARRTHGGRWCVPFPPEVEAACRQKITDSFHLTPPTPNAPTGGAV